MAWTFGQRVDHSALCVVEEIGGLAVVKSLVKYPLGTPYPLVMKTVVDTFKSVHLKGDVFGFAVDATGVGSVPAQQLQEMIPEARIEPFIFTYKSKCELVGKIRVLHGFGKLKFAMRKGDEFYNRTLRELIQEMKTVQGRVLRDSVENPEIEVFKTGTHDDLFTALALAVKDIRIASDWGGQVQLVPKNDWLKTPLDNPLGQEQVVFYF